MKPINLRIAEELGVREQQVATAISLLDGGATVAGFYERNGAVRIGRPRMRCPAVCCRSMSSGSPRGGRRDLGPHLGRQFQALKCHRSRSGRSMSLRIRSG
jgi:hypothetical protein